MGPAVALYIIIIIIDIRGGKFRKLQRLYRTLFIHLGDRERERYYLVLAPKKS